MIPDFTQFSLWINIAIFVVAAVLTPPDPMSQIGTDPLCPLLAFLHSPAEVCREERHDVGVVQSRGQLVGELGPTRPARPAATAPDVALRFQRRQMESCCRDVDP